MKSSGVSRLNCPHSVKTIQQCARYLKAVIDFALERDDLKRELIEYLAKKRLALEDDGPS
jgi:hypothetical protein